MTAKDPAARPQSYGDLLQRLESSSVRMQSSPASEAGRKRIFMDRHNLDINAEDLASAHQHDLAIQSQYGVKAMTYWFDHEHDRAHCLLEAPNAEAVIALHRHAHGSLPNEIIEVQPELVEAFMGWPIPRSSGISPSAKAGFER